LAGFVEMFWPNLMQFSHHSLTNEKRCLIGGRGSPKVTQPRIVRLR